VSAWTGGVSTAGVAEVFIHASHVGPLADPELQKRGGPNFCRNFFDDPLLGVSRKNP